MKKQRKPDRRIRRTRRQLYRAFYGLIKQMPYDEISVSKIVDQADISRATFYLHYKDKHELLIDSLDALFSGVVDDLQNMPLSDDLATDIHSIALHIFQHVYDNQVLYFALRDNDISSFVILNRVVDIVQSRLRKSVASPQDDSLRSDPIAHQTAGALYGLVLWWLKHDMAMSPADMAQKSHDFFVHGSANALNLTKPPTN